MQFRTTFYILSFTLFLFSSANSRNVSDPQTNLLIKGCSQYNVLNEATFFVNRNETFADIKNQLRTKKFATAEQARGSDRVFALAQCRNYLSISACLRCISIAETQLRNCSNPAANGARVVYDGCLFRYESEAFFDETTMPGNSPVCSNKTVAEKILFTGLAHGFLSDLCAATPNVPGYFAAAKRVMNHPAAAAAAAMTVYGIAQCTETVTKSGCRDCLSVAYQNSDSCPPDADGRSVDAGCFLRYSDTAFFPENQTIDLTPFLRSSESASRKIIIGGIVGGVGLILILILLFILVRRLKKTTTSKKGDILGATELRGPVNFHYSDLKSATNNFSEKNKLGEGGFGDVYKGVLKNGKTVAVKKLTVGKSSRAQADFQSEVKLISNVHHRNLIRLLGCCNKGPELLLVYEYMENSSLDKFVFGDRRGSLDWKHRLDIIIGMARGLAYLHEEFHVCIIHRDIKSSNILLDTDLQPKIADFGLARLLPGDRSHLSTRFAGTLGYTAPEYAIHGQLSEKVDTYSYGVVVLEIVSGRKSNDTKLEPSTQYLLEWAWRLYEEDMLMNLVDESLDSNKYDATEVKKVLEVALLCTQSSVSSRPTMSEVVVLLLSKGEPSLKPTRPTFIDATNRVRGDNSSSSSSNKSNATASMSLTGR